MGDQSQSLDRRRIQRPLASSERRQYLRRQAKLAMSEERRRLEKRRSIRKPLAAQVNLTCLDTKVDCVPKDINSEGINVTIKTMPDLLATYSVKIGFFGRVFFDLSARILHTQELEGDRGYRIGLQFAAASDWEKALLATVVSGLPLEPFRASSQTLLKDSEDQRPSRTAPAIDEKFNKKLKIERFMLLVNGAPLDTGRYEYFPYVDRLITDRKMTMGMIHQLKAGQLPAGYEKYVYAQYCIGQRETNQLAIEAAYKASQEFRYWSLKKRKKIMEDVHALLLEHREKLIELMVVEGHPFKLASWEFEGMEVAYRKASLDFYAAHLNERIKNECAGEKLLLRRRSDGVVCVIPPKNASCSNSLIAGFALLAGNALIVKPPLKNPIATIYLWNNIINTALNAHDVPRGVLNIVNGNSNGILEEWINSPFVNDILYFGDSEAGIEIGTDIYRAGKKPILELSGNDLLFVWKDAPLDQAVAALLDGFLGSTQICMVPKKALIHEDVYDEFRGRFVSEACKLRVGLPTEPDVLLSPVMKIPQFYKCLNDALEKGAKLLCGGERVDHNNIPDKNGVFITPAVLEVEDVEKALAMQCFTDENFFPLIPIVKVKAGSTPKAKDDAIFKKMVSLSNGHPYGLRLSVWVSSQKYIQKFADYLDNSGLLRINSRHVGFSEGLGSHGGTRRSGGPFGEMNYIWQKTSHLQGISITNPR